MDKGKKEGCPGPTRGCDHKSAYRRTHRYTDRRDTMTDANQLYNLSHAILPVCLNRETEY